MLVVKMFGPFEVWRSGRLLGPHEWPHHKARALLKVLLTFRGKVLTVEQLSEMLYPDQSPKTASGNTRAAIAGLRTSLEPKLKLSKDSRYVLHSAKSCYLFSEDAPLSLDVDEFMRELQLAEKAMDAQDWNDALAHYRQALELYRGEYLAEDPYEEWTAAPREQYRERYLKAMEDGARCHARMQQFRRAVELCQLAIAQARYRESLYRELMEYSYFDGDLLRAVETYSAYQRAVAELGFEPAREMDRLMQRIQHREVRQD